MPGFKGQAAPSTPQPAQPPAQLTNVPETPTRGDDSIPATPKGEGLPKRASFIEVEPKLSTFFFKSSLLFFRLVSWRR